MSGSFLVDSHAHIQGEEFSDDIDGVIQRAKQAGVEKIVVVGGAGDLASNQRAVALARSHDGLFATVGMHPHDAKAVSEEELAQLRELAKDSKVVAIGETGLDFYYNHSPREIQMKIFRRFIGMARATELPLIVHDRDAHREIAELLLAEGERKLRGVIHCFTGDYQAAKAFLDLGFYISFSGIVTFKNAAPLREVAQKLPLDRIFVETDSPYLAPVPHRGKRNEPAFVRLVAETIASVREMPLEDLIHATSQNAHALFGI
ncbi:MAG: hydrolase TatD [Deltaproteobacteria bacterium RIFCSPLOWO2_12_FULL_60_19]|nr:MAG: hydrolase TatD [Deltaproteobacteria bacterium RIFCSPLOWO2_12_FULL_60_19]